MDGSYHHTEPSCQDSENNPILRELLTGNEGVGFMEMSHKLSTLVENTQLKLVDICVYNIDDYFINMGLVMNLYMHGVNIQRYRRLCPTLAPRFVDYQEFGNSYCLLTTEVPGGGQTWPEPCIHMEKLPIASRQRAADEIRTLADQREALIFKPASFYYVAHSEMIICNNWSDMASLKGEEAKHMYLKRVNMLLGLTAK